MALKGAALRDLADDVALFEGLPDGDRYVAAKQAVDRLHTVFVQDHHFGAAEHAGGDAFHLAAVDAFDLGARFRRHVVGFVRRPLVQSSVIHQGIVGKHADDFPFQGQGKQHFFRRCHRIRRWLLLGGFFDGFVLGLILKHHVHRFAAASLFDGVGDGNHRGDGDHANDHKY